jgi:hypothetical protein
VRTIKMYGSDIKVYDGMIVKRGGRGPGAFDEIVYRGFTIVPHEPDSGTFPKVYRGPFSIMCEYGTHQVKENIHKAKESIDSWLDFKKARGRCGFNVSTPVYGQYINGVALFAFQITVNWWYCVITGHMTCGGNTMESVCQDAVKRVLNSSHKDADQRYTRSKFNILMEGGEVP